MLGPSPRARLHDVYTLTARIKAIARLARQDMLDGHRGPQLRALAGAIVKHCPVRGDVGQPRADLCELQSVFEWIVDHVRYSGDIGPMRLTDSGPREAVDLYQSPFRTIQMGVSDCDDMAPLVMVLLRYLGWDVILRVSSSDGKAWSHIWALALCPKVPVLRVPQRWVPMDTTLGHGKIGVAPTSVKHLDFKV